MALSIENVLYIINLIFLVIGGVFIYIQWRKSISIKRAEFINQILEKLRFDKILTDAMYKLEYEVSWYDSSFHGSIHEKPIDTLLSYLNYICYLKETRIISQAEFNMIKYTINRVCSSESSQKYLWNLFQYSKSKNSQCSFQYLIDYGISSGCIPMDFKTNQILYEKTLNF